MKPAPPPLDPEELERRALPLRRPAGHLWLRWAALGTGAALLAWLPLEDVNPAWPLLLSGLGCFLAAVALLHRAGGGAAPWPHLLAGLLGGAAVPLGAVLLMVFKTGVHTHAVTDFTPAQINAVLTRTPVFALGGLLMGLGAALWRKAR